VTRPSHLSPRADGHLDGRAVEATIRWADAAAARSDFAEAVHWLRTVTAAGSELPAGYAAKEAVWRLAAERGWHRLTQGAAH